jgi:hypothetical protein
MMPDHIRAIKQDVVMHSKHLGLRQSGTGRCPAHALRRIMERTVLYRQTSFLVGETNGCC